MTYRCATCGEQHHDLPHVGPDEPLPVHDIPEAERDRRVVLTSDTCIIDDEHFFIRGVIGIPVRDDPGQSFGFLVWVSLKRENFQRYLDEPQSDAIGPFFGWLSSRIDFYGPDTFLLKTMAHFRAGGMRPTIELEPTGHPLAVDQREGITLARAWEIVHFYERHA